MGFENDRVLGAMRTTGPINVQFFHVRDSKWSHHIFCGLHGYDVTFVHIDSDIGPIDWMLEPRTDLGTSVEDEGKY